MFKKGDWVTTQYVDTIPFKLDEDSEEYVLDKDVKGLTVRHPRTKELMPVSILRLATEQDFIKSHQRMIEKRDAVVKSLQQVAEIHGEFLRDTRNFHITD